MTVALILAAGRGTRMKSDLPKVAHAVCGRPMVTHVLSAARQAGAQRLIVVVGHGAETVRGLLADEPDVEFALQDKQLGTGHAVMVCRPLLESHRGSVLVLAGDVPLIRSASLAALLATQQDHQAACVVGSAVTENNAGLGRIVRDERGEFLRIVEDRDATPEQRRITEINTGCYAFDNLALLAALNDLRPENDQAEYYLPDTAAILKGQGNTVRAEPAFDIEEAMGVNTPEQLAAVEAVLRGRTT